MERPALAHLEAGECEAAAAIYEELWRQVAGPELAEDAPEALMVARGIGRLVEACPEMRLRMGALAEPAHARVMAGVETINEFEGWIQLQNGLGDFGGVEQLVSEARGAPSRLRRLQSDGRWEEIAFTGLVGRERWELAGLVFRDPIGAYTRYELSEAARWSPPGLLLRMILPLDPPPERTHGRFNSVDAAWRHATCLAAGRERDAARVYSCMRTKLGDTSAQAACAWAALRAGVVREQHAEWFRENRRLAEAEPELAAEVRAAVR